MKHLKQKNAKGFTLVELMVTIVVAAIVITALNEVVTGFLHVSQRGRYLNLANSFVESEVEALRNESYNSLSVGTTSLTSQLPSQLPPASSGSITISNPQAGLKQIDLSVSYNDQGVSNTYSYTTYIGELGVGQ
jgi:prepilin-type N-terminal cleavage/methylation domain-containing protein